MRTQRFVLLGAAFALVGCTESQQNQADDEAVAEEAGMAILEDSIVVERAGLAISLAAGTAGLAGDVAQIHYQIERVACVAGEQFAPLRRATSQSLAPMLLPGGIPSFENAPLDEESEHPFADHFELLPPGCYDITATPLRSDGSPSEECGQVSTKCVRAFESQTTEVFMIIQCEGPQPSAIDAAVALNRPPELVGLAYNPAKFIRVCDTTRVCATAIDPNNDPVEFEWREVSGSSLGVRVVSRTTYGNRTMECVEVAPTSAGDYLLDATVYDQLHDENGNLIRFERWLRDHGNPSRSSASLQFPIHVGRR